MRSILSIIAFFSCSTLCAQAYIPAAVREAPRSEVIACPTEAEAGADSLKKEPSRYFKPLTAWNREGATFTTGFAVPFAWANREVLLRIASASAPYDVLLNGTAIASDADGNTPAEFNLTAAAKEGANTLSIALRDPNPNAALESWKGNSAPAIGEVWVQSQPMIRVREILTRTWDSESGPKAQVGVVVKTGALNPKSARIYYEVLSPAGERITSGHEDITLDMRRQDTMRILVPLRADQLWSTAAPRRCILRLKTQIEGRYTEYLQFRLGFRTLTADKGILTINGKPETLYTKTVSPTLPATEIGRLKAQGYNTLKLSAGAVPDTFYEICDTTGIYVIAQAPIDTRSAGLSRRKGGNPTNDPVWGTAYLERSADSYHTAKLHPSVIAFSLADGSANGINLYESYLNMKALEHERPIIYPDAAGEWNTDKLILEPAPGPVAP